MSDPVAPNSKGKDIKRKTHFQGIVAKTSLAGAIIDIGLEKPGIVHISQIQKDPKIRMVDVLNVGDIVDVWVRQVNKNAEHLDLTMIEPVALEWGEMNSGDVVKGEVVRLEKFGAFIEIGAQRPGLAHISEITHDYIREIGDALKVGDQ
ncbi:MAG: S1 RNA-binding domain-containing protein, partial [Chloroflexi bacterium]|nr:S1 RNA-binding domain-containing protein [Chloroflexota bacterium]